MFITRSAQDIARDAVQIFGGRGITKSGMGKHIEHVRTTQGFMSSAQTLILLLAFYSIIGPCHLTLFSAEVSAIWHLGRWMCWF